MSKIPDLKTISQFAKEKKCSRQTVYNNIDQLTIIKVGWNNLVVMDKKARDWIPKENMKRSKQISKELKRGKK